MTMDPQDFDGSYDLGTCCGCGTSKGVVNVVMLPRRSPTPGKGWGCVVCGLPGDGAIMVMCDACVGTDPLFVCRGYPGKDGRALYSGLSPEPFDHDPAAHAKDDAE